MGSSYRFLAIDLGAESGRVVLGALDRNQFSLEEIYRFPTRGVNILGTLQWDIALIFTEIIAGLAKYARQYGPHVDGIGIDSWGVDFGLVDGQGTLLGNPVHYRDKRTDGIEVALASKLSLEEIYFQTGITYNRFNTLLQLYAVIQARSPILEIADSMMMIGDLLHYMLCGRRSMEYTNASTTQLLDPYQKTWHEGLIQKIGAPRRLFGEITPAGTILGTILPEVAAATGLDPNTPVISPATHDTASAIASVPADDSAGAWTYISSGTWSIVGARRDEPCITGESFRGGFSNEGGADGRFCFHKHLIGLWLLQECRRIWERDQEGLDYGQLTEEAAEAEGFQSLINVDDPRLYSPADMPETIRELCREVGQPVPSSRGAFVRCILESMALRYRTTLKELDRVLHRTTEKIHIIGGGVKNPLLCQAIADACGVPVAAGPVEGATYGNFAVQAVAVGAIGSLDEVHRVIARSESMTTYLPARTAIWDEIEASHTPLPGAV